MLSHLEKRGRPLPELIAHFEHPRHSEILPWRSKDLDGGSSPAGAKLGAKESEPPGSIIRRRTKASASPSPWVPRSCSEYRASLCARFYPGSMPPPPHSRSLPGSAGNNNGISPPGGFKTIQAFLPVSPPRPPTHSPKKHVRKYKKGVR